MSRSTAPFSSPSFVRYQLARLFSILAMQIVSVAVGWQVYMLTNSTTALGLVGGIQFLPLLFLWPVTGSLADRYDRKRVVWVAWAGAWLGTVCLWLLSLAAVPSFTAILATLLVLGSARALSAAAGPALLPSLVEPEDFSAAAAWSSTTFSVGVILGPAMGGVCTAFIDTTGAYAVAAGLLTLGLIALRGVRPIRPADRSQRPTTWSDAMAGLRLVFDHPILLGAISLDLFAVLLGGAVALLPVYARDILHVGPVGFGALRAAPAVGALVMAVWITARPPTRRIGWTLYASVGAFGLATIGFGLSTTFLPALLFLVLVGATDGISVWIRQIVVQLATPDAVRGRVSAVEFVFIGASNELGELESGLLATAIGPVGAVVAGGFGTLGIVALASGLSPALRRVDTLADIRAGSAG